MVKRVENRGGLLRQKAEPVKTLPFVFEEVI